MRHQISKSSCNHFFGQSPYLRSLPTLDSRELVCGHSILSLTYQLMVSWDRPNRMALRDNLGLVSASSPKDHYVWLLIPKRLI